MSVQIPLQDKMTMNGTVWDFKGKVDYVDTWLLMGTPMPVAVILLGYLSIVLKLGPDYMKAKKAINLGSTLAFYNAAQVIMSCYLAYIGTSLILQNGIIGSSCLMDEEADRYQITYANYMYLVAKLSELLDTVFFVLKKNLHQITFLHVYHHSLMLASTWLTLKYEPSYNVVFLGTLNSYVHIVMYTYYYLSSFPNLSKYLWWKKYITKMQIGQFIIIILQAAATSSFSGCATSYTLLATIMLNAFLFTGLFINFYIQSYKKTMKEE